MSRKHKAFIVDDDPKALEYLRGVCEALGHEVDTAASVEEADAKFKKNRYCYSLLDVILPMREGLTPWPRAGVTFLKTLRDRLDWKQLPVLVITGFGSQAVTVAAFKAGANDFATKPFEEEAEEPLNEKIRQALAFGCESRRSCPHLSGDEPGAKRIYLVRYRIHFLGDLKRGRALIEIDGVPYWVRRNTFEMLFRLAHEDRLTTDPDGWVHGTALVDGLTNHSHALAQVVADIERVTKIRDLVERDMKGRMRLCTPPDCVTWDLKAMLASNHGKLVRAYCA